MRCYSWKRQEDNDNMVRPDGTNEHVFSLVVADKVDSLGKTLTGIFLGIV